MSHDCTIVGLTGRAHTGKDATADYLMQEYDFERAAFADVMRTMLELMLTEVNVDYAYLYEPALKNTPIDELGVSARAMMQTLGTEWGRRCMGDDWWVRLATRRLGLYAGGSPIHDRIVITDVRFPNEAAWLSTQGGTLLRLVRDSALPVRPHESESWVDGLDAHLELANHGPTLVGLHGLVDSAMQSLGIDRRPTVRGEWR